MKQKGISLIELLVSIMLLCVVMISFAMVFPGGYRLNLKNRMESKASQYANGVMYKLKKITFFSATGMPAGIPTIERIFQNNWDSYEDYFEGDVRAPFFLPPTGSNLPPGILVQILDRDEDNQGTLAKLTVTVAWQETVGGEVVNKYVTVTSYRSCNHN